jgi:hypothetical protein
VCIKNISSISLLYIKKSTEVLSSYKNKPSSAGDDVSIASELDITATPCIVCANLIWNSRTEREQNRQNCRVFRSASLAEFLPKNPMRVYLQNVEFLVGVRMRR